MTTRTLLAPSLLFAAASALAAGFRAIRPEPAASEEAAGFVSTPPSRRRSGGG